MSKGGQTATQQTTQQLNPFVQDLLTRGFGAAQQVSSIPYQSYQGPRIAQFRPQEQQAFGIAEQAVANRVGAPQLEQATQAAQRAAGYSPAQFQTDVKGFMSPYQENVVDATMRRLAQSRAERDAATKASLAASRAFGNERRGVYEAQLAGEQDLNTAQTLANLYQQGYGQAAGLASNLPAQQLAGASQLAGFGTQALSQDQARQQMLAGVGQAQRGMAQQNLDLAYQDFLAQRGYPVEQLKILQSGISGVPATTSSTTTATQPGQGFLGTAGDILGVAGAAKSLFQSPDQKMAQTFLSWITGGKG
jgi:hypothetical protein